MSANENAASWFVDRHVTEGRGAKTAFREAFGAGRKLSYGDLAEASGRVAAALSRAGHRREERAAMLVLDQIEFPQIFWGCLKAGVIPIPLNTLLAPDVYNVILRDCRASVLFVSAELLETVSPALSGNPYLRHLVVLGDAPAGVETGPARSESWDSFLGDAAPVPAVEADADEVAFWLYSSGSTGQPKGVRHVHHSLRYTADTYGAEVLGIEEADTVYSVAKFFFAYGLGNAMTFPMSAGATTVLFNGRPTPEVAVRILSEEKPTVFCGVPTLYAATVAHLEGQGGAPEVPLRRCISAGEALPEEIGKRWRALFGVDILDGVGSTEMLHIFLSNRPGDVVYGTSGRAVPGYELRLVDEDGREITATGEIGELLVSGHSAAEGYWNKRRKSRTTFEGEWTRTGDKYEVTSEGRYVYCGRTDDMFKVSGIWVSPFEVEQALVAHPGVLEAAVVAGRDENGLEKPRAFIVPKAGQDGAALAEELREFVKARIGKWKYPRWIEVVEDLPKTATGKIQRFKLREVA